MLQLCSVCNSKHQHGHEVQPDAQIAIDCCLSSAQHACFCNEHGHTLHHLCVCLGRLADLHIADWQGCSIKWRRQC